MSRSIASNLARSLGGKWTYVPFCGRWECDDGVRSVQRYSVLGGMTGDEYVGSEAWLYGEGKPKRAEHLMADSEAKTLFPF